LDLAVVLLPLLQVVLRVLPLGVLPRRRKRRRRKKVRCIIFDFVHD
jgi:hypothetical protein